jgi:hypothetical protein
LGLVAGAETYFLVAHASEYETDRNNAIPITRKTVRTNLTSILMARAIDTPHSTAPIKIFSALMSACRLCSVVEQE